MIDSGATNSFINTRFLASTAIRKRLKDIPQEIQVIDGRPIASGQVTHHTGPLELEINGHYETLALDITTLGDYPVIIGLPWLARHNPLINWTQQTLVFNSGYCKRNCSKRKYRSKNNRVPTMTTTMKMTSQPIMNGNLPGTEATDTPTNQNNKRCCGSRMSRPDNRVPCKGADHGAATTTTSLDVNSQDARPTSHSIKAVEVRKTIKTTRPTTTRPVPVTPPSSPARLAMARKIALMKTRREKSKPITVALVNGKSFKFSLKDAKVYGITMFNDKGLIDPKPAQDDDGQDLAKDELRKAVPPEFHEYLNVFSKKNAEKLPESGRYDHAIELEDNQQPKFGPIYGLSEVELRVLDEYLKDNLKTGFIRPSTSPAGSPILFVKKKDGSLRLCVDYRALNKITRKNRYPLPLIQESLDRLKTAKYFTKIDLRAAYNLIRIKPGDEWKTAFRTRYGLYEYLVMPFGLTNAPASFQYLINDVLRDYLDNFVIVYLDDILIFSKTHEEHVTHVKQVLKRLEDNSLWAKAEKCEFFQDSVDFLGYIVSDKGISMDPKKVEAIVDWPVPKNVHDIQVFLGFANFYRRFIKSYSKVTSPLTRLLRKGINFEWTTKEQEAFDDLKKRFTTAPILQHFQPDLPLVLETDASDFAIAGVLSHSIDGKLYPIAFYSRKLNNSELNYEIYDKEMLAIVEAFKHWRAYLEGSPNITVYTDHKNLEYFTTSKVLNRRQARWAELLAQYDFKIVYRPGSKMGKPDALTRRQDLRGGSRAAEAPPRTLLKPGQYISATTNLTTNDLNYDNMTETIKTTQQTDPELQDIIKHLRQPSLLRSSEIDVKLAQPYTYDMNTNLLYYDNRLYIPNNHALKLQVVQHAHNHPTSGHMGQQKTLDLVERYYYFPGMRQFVKTYVNGCHTCARNKPTRHKPFGPLQPLPIPQRPWKSISIDAIVKLPTSNGYDSIMVIVDRRTKQAHFVPFTEEGFDSPKLAQLYRKHIFRLHGLPDDITSDRGSIFVSNFTKELNKSLGITSNTSTAFHPQTDGQTERVNQVLEQYLRHYCNDLQNDWTSYLDLAEFAYNNSVHTSTKFTPFEANYGYHPRHPLAPPAVCDVPAVTDYLSRLHNIQNNLTTNIEIAQRNQAKYYDRTTKNKPHDKDGEPKFKVGSWVFLNRRYIESKRPSKKLDQRLLGPFQIIKETKSPMAYVLDLPPSMSQLHPVFHVSLLEPMREGHNDQYQDPPPAIEVEGEPEYAVEHILDSRINPDDDGFDYLVHWKDYTNDHDSWEPWEEIHDTTAYKTFARQNKYNNRHVFPTTYHKRKQHQKQDSYQPISTTTEPNQLRRSKRIRHHKQN